MSAYTRLIRRLAPSEDPERVEAWLRREHGTLESIGAVQFAGAVKSAVARMHDAQHQQAHEHTSVGAAGGR